jgi:cytochrome c oxidase assembly protein subunit 20
MAQDDDKPPRLRGPPPGATEPPEHVKKPQIYEIFHGSKPQDQAEDSQTPPRPGPGTGPTEKPQKPPTVVDAVKSIKPGDFFTVHQTPCARQGFMTGIGAGALIGALRFMIGGSWSPTDVLRCETF